MPDTKVRTRSIGWRELVRMVDPHQEDEPVIGYEFAEGVTKLDPDPPLIYTEDEA